MKLLYSLFTNPLRRLLSIVAVAAGLTWLYLWWQILDHTFSAYFKTGGFWLGLLLLLSGLIPAGNASKALGRWERAAGALLMAAWLFMVFLYPIGTADDKFAAAQAEVKDAKMEQIDIKHIPSVPKAYAKYKGDKMLGQVPNFSFYQMGDYSIQKIDDELVWVAPIEYNGFFKSINAGAVTAYVKISAEDENAPAELLSGYEMKYVPSGYFSGNIYRHIRANYPYAVLYEASFEPKDNGAPVYVVPYGHYEKFRQVSLVDGVFLVDPESGAVEQYPMDRVPAFVDQVVPVAIADAYNTYFGKYKHGFLNSLIGKRDLHMPTTWEDGDEVVAVFDQDGNMSWFTDHTTLDETSKSLVGYSLINARTGKFTYYGGKNVSSSGLANGNAAINSVNKTFLKDQWVGTSPTLYNIYGEDTWFVPVIDGNGLLRELALVNARNPQILAHHKIKSTAFGSYKNLLVSSGSGQTDPTNAAQQKEIQGSIVRVFHASEGADLRVKWMMENSDKVFVVLESQYPYAGFLQPGDRVQVQYVDTEELVVTASKVTNLTVNK
ncbi:MULTISPECIES: hypothetical protein [Paenibacillus]|uniref:hypothetical protein n=1 Tax=Paenibacillus TaxID=44249 RepID=UPI0022B8D2EB|nr:hypothetical protein [Paenibacillus caseinilyticus]MCZ8522533.1 hypothetical protein [Paenibacillus caseinilyticus]